MTPFEKQRLRYLEAARVGHPRGTLDGFEICTDSRERLGDLQGVLVEPAQRRVRYFVIAGDGRADGRCLVSAARSARLDSDDSRIYVDARQGDVRPYDPCSVAAFSDMDLVDAIFARQVA